MLNIIHQTVYIIILYILLGFFGEKNISYQQTSILIIKSCKMRYIF